MSTVLLDGWRYAGTHERRAHIDVQELPHRHAGSWATSLALHGLLGGVVVWLITVFALPSPPPVIEAPFRWDVALVSASARPTPPASAAKLSPAQPVQTPRTSPIAAPAESAAAVSSLVSEAAPLPTPQASTVTSEPVVASAAVKHEVPDAVIASAPAAEEVLAPATIAGPVVASAPLNPAVRTVNTGELSDLLWRRMEALKRYPYLARRNGWEGKVLIRVVLGGDGRLLHAEIQESSGHEVLDQDALQVLRAATLLKTEPNLAFQHQATFTLPMAYRLQ